MDNLQFATAWKHGDRQILVYLWFSDNEYFVNHLSMDSEYRVAFSARFDNANEAWGYFQAIRLNVSDARELVEQAVANRLQWYYNESGEIHEGKNH